MNIDDLQRELRSKNGLMTVKMAVLRDAFGAGKLGIHVVHAISRELARRHIGHYPAPLPCKQATLVRLYEQDKPFAKIIEALNATGREGADDVLRRAFVADPKDANRKELTQSLPDRPIREKQDLLLDLIRALNQAETRNHFVSLKWFRDVALPTKNPVSYANVSFDELLRDAISRHIILTHKVHNPKNPQHPVTSIRLNREAAEVQAALATAGPTRGGLFRPVDMPRGGPLSVTILRDRR
jgi:hypothetical protein